ncbi:MAG TPA: ABC transporter ATP-binding protein [Pseudomonadales bacterium]
MLVLDSLVLKPGAEPISHRFAAARITVVLGRNRSGKTALTRVVAGLDAPVAGEVRLHGKSLAGVSPGARPVALVYQTFVNYPAWTVFQNLASPLVAARWGAERLRERVEEIAAKLSLTDLLDRHPDSLSGGQQQRVAIGRALAKGADVLVMDEPLVNLDYKLREALQLELRGLLHELGLCVIYTTTDPRDAFALGDSLLLLAESTLLQSGTPLAVYDRPASAAAAHLMSDPRANRLPGERTVLVRPEHLSLRSRAADDAAFAVEVLATETNGSETFLHCRVEAAAAEDAHWVAHLDGLVDLPAGSRVTLYAAAASLLSFENFSGARAVG